MGVAIFFRDAARKVITPWLGDRPNGLTVGFRYIWSVVSTFDVFATMAEEALQAPIPGVGDPSAFPYIGSNRALRRAQSETDAEYTARLTTWLDRARQWGSMLAVARSIHEYLANRPRVRIYNRAGACYEIAETTGTVTVYAPGTTAWDWDSLSNPERAGYWWDLWICVYPTQWADQGTWGDGRLWGRNHGDAGIGHLTSRVEYDAIRADVEQYKSAHSHVRAIIWTSDATLFDPTDPTTQPDGTWGRWKPVGGTGRNVTTCKYWEM